MSDSPLLHQNKVLRAIRDVNQLIVKESNPEILIRKACDILTKTRGYHNIWIVLFDNNANPSKFSHSGLGESERHVKELLRNNTLTECAEKACKKGHLLIYQNPPADCPGCPLSKIYEGSSAYSMPLISRGKNFGVIVTSIPSEFANDQEEIELFEELTGDIAYALGKINLEKEKIYLEQKNISDMNEISLKLREAISAANIGLWDWNLNDNSVTYSKEWKNQIGYEDFEINNHFSEWEKRVHPDDLEPTLRKIKHSIETNSTHFYTEFRFLHKGGYFIWIFAQASIIHDLSGGPVRVIGSHIDITEIKRTHLRMLRGESRFKNLIKNIPNGAIFLIDKDFRYLIADGMGFKEAGLNSADITGKKVEEVFPELWDKLEVYTKRALSGESVYYEVDYKGKYYSNHTVPIRDPENNELQVLVVTLDITDEKKYRKELETAKETAEKNEKSIKENLKDIQFLKESAAKFVAKNSAEGIYNFIAFKIREMLPSCYVVVNSVSVEKKSLEIKAVAGPKKKLILVNSILGEKVIGLKMNINDDFLRLTNGKLLKFEKGIHEMSFGRIPLLISKTIERTLNIGNLYGIAFVIDNVIYANAALVFPKGSDIEKAETLEAFARLASLALRRSRAENELVAAKEAAEQSNRLKSAFLANISHEIRTPLNGICGFSDLLTLPGLSDEERIEYKNHIRNSSNRLIHTIDDIVNIAKIRSGDCKIEKDTFSLNKILDNLYEFYEKQFAGKNIKLVIKKELSDSEATIITDEKKISSILDNLLKNAFRFTQSGKVEFGYAFKGAEIEFFVKDTGIGIHPDRHEAIFESFVKADIEDKQAYQGTGLGLAIARSFTELLDGKIRVDSKPGKGAKFYFTIRNYTKFTDKTAKSLNHTEGKKFNILIAEDDEVSDIYLTKLVSEFSKNIYHAATGIDALMEAESKDIDLIFMDIKLPGISGFEAARRIKQRKPSLTIIAQTACAMDEDKTKAIENGCDYYLSKPLTKENLFGVISEISLENKI
jgi:PAS domain S-box-containing protein